MKKIIVISLILVLISCYSKVKMIENKVSLPNLNAEVLTIKSIDSFNSSKVYVIKAFNNQNKLFKIVSIKNEDGIEFKDNHKEIEVSKTYSFELYSVFSGISLGIPLKTYTVCNVDISIEPENSIDDLYNTPNLNGLNLIP
ncbi:hypothetical protein SAMN05444671_3855 [Flavobacterium sp. CF108]|uniref:hypothetical protein n=1 Tax=unclassified Flavobacterium TaxID=196869 RepID=UPI0008B6F112|nr:MULTISPECIES: hypothetical protein [unclassified Flavobacterium]SEO96772.1 hypothetical protein SAMN04487978_4116 [Flavobacterium sp. fv08]SHH81134.1 hypothetical protein SAMN05444671_3855 [Flavobacterium sp. CF108]